jgi:insertion element IS1 protein InsB
LKLSKKEPALHQVNHAVLAYLHSAQMAVERCQAEERAQRREPNSELDDMWSYVGKKATPWWLWHAIDHHRGVV